MQGEETNGSSWDVLPYAVLQAAPDAHGDKTGAEAADGGRAGWLLEQWEAVQGWL